MAARRLPDLSPDEMSPEQTAIRDAIASGPRKKAAGPFPAWLRSPELADRLQKVGEYVRFHSSLPPRLSEFAILLAGRHWNSPYEWDRHYPLAVEAGVSPSVLAAISEGKEPVGMPEDEAMIYRFTTELPTTKAVSDPTYETALALFGERGIVEIIAIAGYYDIVCMTLNVARVSVPEDSKGAATRGAGLAARSPVKQSAENCLGRTRSLAPSASNTSTPSTASTVPEHVTTMPARAAAASNDAACSGGMAQTIS